jgi:hypothetical protein
MGKRAPSRSDGRLLARKGDEPGTMLAWSLFAVRATNSSKTFMQITALEKGFYRTSDDRSPVAVFGLKPLVVDLLKRVKMLID